MHLEDLGWDAAFEEAFRPFAKEGFVPARICREQNKGFIVHAASGEFPAQLTGKSRDEGLRVAVGDWVAIRTECDVALVEALLPRRSRFARKVATDATGEQVVAANIDVAFLVSGLDDNFNVRRIERYLTLAWDSGAVPVILLNKEDLCDDVPSRVAEAASVAGTVAVHSLSARTGRGLESIRTLLGRGRTAVLLGSSGVGKSALVNALLGEDRQDTGAVREDDSRGRHTTTMRELVVLPSGGLLIDTPGMRELQLWADVDDLRFTFGEIDAAARACRYRDCSHVREPGCGVQAAIRRGAVADARFESFLRLRAELESLERRRAEKERKRVRTRRPEERAKRREDGYNEGQ